MYMQRKTSVCDAGKRRKQSRWKATEVMLDLIQMARHAGLTAKYVLFDSWFTSPKSIAALKQEQKLDVIAMIKKSSKVKYVYQGKWLDIKKIYSKNTGNDVVVQSIFFL